MTWRSHVLVGVASLWLLEPIPGALASGAIGEQAAMAALGALLPDLDAARSKLSAWEALGTQPLLPLAATLNGALGHRGFLHSLPAWLALGAACVALSHWLPWETLLALWTGYGSHLAADACTKAGIPAWTRCKGRRWHLLPPRMRLTTGSAAEDALLVPLALAVLALLLRGLAPA